jgi:hypothetical protein
MPISCHSCTAMRMTLHHTYYGWFMKTDTIGYEEEGDHISFGYTTRSSYASC